MLSGAGTGIPQKIILITDTVNYIFNNYSNNFNYIPVFSLKPILGDFADVILGMGCFSNRVIEVNYVQEYLRLHNNISAIDTSENVKIQMIKKQNRLLVPASIQINDSVFIREYFLLDFGSGGSFSITSHAAKKYNLSKNIDSKILYYDKYGGVSGESSSWVFKSICVEIGGYRLNEVVMDYSEDKRGALASDSYSGLLGNNVLDRFNIIINFINEDLYLKPNSYFKNPYKFSKLGFRYTDRSATKNVWIVAGLYKSSNAEIAGLKIDDEIVSVNGIDIKKVPFKEQEVFFEKIDNIVLVVLRDSEKKHIKYKLDNVL